MYGDPSDARDFRRGAARDRAAKVRDEAIKALGGKCEKCQIESDPRDLKIIVLGEAKGWSQVVFYRRVAEYPEADRKKLARLICNKCRFNEVQEARFRSAYKEPKPDTTGEFYWVAGELVEQHRLRTGKDSEGNLVVYRKLDDGEFSAGWTFSEPQSEVEYWD